MYKNYKYQTYLLRRDPPQQPNSGPNGPNANDEDDPTIPRRLGNSTFQDIIDSEGPPAISFEQFINDPFLSEKFNDEEVQNMFSAIEEDPAVIPQYKDNPKFLEVVRYIADLFAPSANDPAMHQQGGNFMEAANLMNLFGGQGGAEQFANFAQQFEGAAQFLQGQGQNGDPIANLNQLIQDQGGNPMENMGQDQGINQMADLAQLLGGQWQGGNPMANLNQLPQGQDGNHMENMQGQGGNPMANLFQLLGGQGVNPMANVNQGQGQEQNHMANLAQMLSANPMENIEGQAGNPMANLLQLLGGQHGNPMENMNQGQGQGQNPMANLAHLFGGQGQGGIQGNEDQLAYLQEYLNMM
ncbi:hypothetical protein CHS0354_040095 [Potamilus streckersoni]|uniref:Uncharacterized protein n=1 Tax=Potamilus streckersoni TaxID=2493646 RepID=A0AAE0W1I9_9BIVA|nr:hypothetical protein CHS0354_040095 [Potamilus streckersoni]